MKHRFVGQSWSLAATGAALALCVSGSHVATTHAQVAKPVIKRASTEEIRKQVDRTWFTKAATTDLMDYWNRHSVEPNGFIQENLDRQWKPWGTQREATINGQGRQLYSMAVAYEMARSKEAKAALVRGMDFLLKMRDAEFGGYYDRVGPNRRDHHRQQDRLQQLRALLAGRMPGASPAIAVSSTRRWCSSARCATRCATGRSSARAVTQRDFMLRLPGGMFGGGRPGAGGPGGPGAPVAPAVRAAWRPRRRAGRGRSAGTPPAGGPAQGPPTGFAGRRHGINLHAFEALLSLYERHGLRRGLVRNLVRAEGHRAALRLKDWLPAGVLRRQLEAGRQPERQPRPLVRMGVAAQSSGGARRRSEVHRDGQPQSRPRTQELQRGRRRPGRRDAGRQAGAMLWWPQCEVIKATATYAILHGRSELWPVHHKTLAFVKKEYLDTEHGGWFADVVPGQPRAERGSGPSTRDRSTVRSGGRTT